MGLDEDQNYVEIDVDELHKIIEEHNEIEIELDDFAAYTVELSYQNAEEDEMNAECLDYADVMRKSLENGEYHKALDNAKELKRRCYLKYREEIGRCYEICARHDVLEALVYEVDKFTKSGGGRVIPEAFPFLEKLNAMGYIDSFRWVADCYFGGIGCEKDKIKSERLYFEGMLFGKSDYCRNMYGSMHPELEKYNGDDLLKNLVRNISFSRGVRDDYERIKIAELILDGRIKEYRHESAYVLLKNAGYTYDGYADYLLGECVLNGIGTTANLIVAKQLFELAFNDMECLIRDFDDDWARRIMEESYHEKNDYENAFDNINRLLDEIKYKIISVDLMNGFIDEDQLYDDWYNEKAQFIVRSFEK